MIAKLSLILAIATTFTLSAPNLVNGISFYVNNQPVTLFELYKSAQSANVSKEQAMELLVNKMLHKDEIERYAITASEEDIDKEFALVAKNSGATTEQFRAFLNERGVDLGNYKNELKERVLRDKLYTKIVQNNLRMADERELMTYYEANKNLFSIPAKIETIKYSSKNRDALIATMQSPLQEQNDVTSTSETIITAKINPQLVAILQETQQNKFTQIFTIGDEYLTFLIKDKSDFTLIPFENAKEAVFGRLMMEKEDKVIQEHFEKLRASAKVKVIRLD